MNKIKLTEDVPSNLDDCLEEYKSGVSPYSLYKKYGYSHPSTIYAAAKRRGIPTNRKFWTDDEIEKIYRNEYLGQELDVKMKDLSARHNIDRHTLIRRFRKLDCYQTPKKRDRKIYQAMHGAKKRAEKKGWDFDLDYDFIASIWATHCPIFKTKMSFGKKDRPNSPSIDRIDPKKGYTKDNVWIISYRANTIKNDATLQELETLVKAVRDRVLGSHPIPQEGDTSQS